MARSELPFRIEGRRVWVAGHRGMVRETLTSPSGSSSGA